MAGSSLLALIDDISTLLDDVSMMTKVAAEKTAGVLGDDLALNAKQVTGVNAEREIPVVWAVAKGSFVNKLILVPAALAISALIPWAIVPLLMFGGLFLCFEGVEKLAHRYLHSKDEIDKEKEALKAAAADNSVDMLAFEKDKIKGAIRTDFVLSAEIITIALGTVADASFTERVFVLCSISILMTVGVYGLVAAIVKLDDLGYRLTRNARANFFGKIRAFFGRKIILLTPYLMKLISVIGTVAMFMVGGGILTHGVHSIGETFNHIGLSLGNVLWIGGFLKVVVPVALDALFGVLAGAVALMLWKIPQKLFFRDTTAH